MYTNILLYKYTPGNPSLKIPFYISPSDYAVILCTSFSVISHKVYYF